MSLGPLIALYAAGLATFASPCVLPMLPLYLGVLAGAQTTGKTDGSSRRLRLAGLGFAVGLGLVFVLLGVGATLLTQSLSAYRLWFDLGAGTVMLLFGAKLLGWIKVPWLDREARPLLHRVPNLGGFMGGLLFGAGFAVGWTPCVGPVLATALTYAASSTADPIAAGGLLSVYALGLATPLVVGSFAASRLLAWTTRLRTYTPALQRVTGALMVALGLSVSLPPLAKLSTMPGAVANCNNAKVCDSKSPLVASAANLDELPRGPALVEFTSEHCSVCKRMIPLVNELEGRCKPGLIVKVNVDDPAGEKLAAHYGVTMVPTFVSIDPSGGEVERMIGEQSKQRLVLALNEVSGKPCGLELSLLWSGRNHVRPSPRLLLGFGFKPGHYFVGSEFAQGIGSDPTSSTCPGVITPIGAST